MSQTTLSCHPSFRALACIHTHIYICIHRARFPKLKYSIPRPARLQARSPRKNALCSARASAFKAGETSTEISPSYFGFKCARKENRRASAAVSDRIDSRSSNLRARAAHVELPRLARRTDSDTAVTPPTRNIRVIGRGGYVSIIDRSFTRAIGIFCDFATRDIPMNFEYPIPVAGAATGPTVRHFTPFDYRPHQRASNVSRRIRQSNRSSPLTSFYVSLSLFLIFRRA